MFFDLIYYFWRMWSQQAIDFIEEHGGQLFAYEFKWKPQAKQVRKAWQQAYPDSEFQIIDTNNYLGFIT